MHALAELKKLPITPLDLLVCPICLRLYLADVIQEIAGDMSTYKPSQEVSARWERATCTLYDPFDSSQKLQEQEIMCPKCNVQLFVREFAPSYSHIHQ